MDNKTYKCTTYLSPEVAEKLKVLAKQDYRSLASLTQKILSDYADKNFKGTIISVASDENDKDSDIEDNIIIEKPKKVKIKGFGNN